MGGGIVIGERKIGKIRVTQHSPSEINGIYIGFAMNYDLMKDLEKLTVW